MSENEERLRETDEEKELQRKLEEMKISDVDFIDLVMYETRSQEENH